jgi:hypothetical protein
MSAISPAAATVSSDPRVRLPRLHARPLATIPRTIFWVMSTLPTRGRHRARRRMIEASTSMIWPSLT